MSSFIGMVLAWSHLLLLLDFAHPGLKTADANGIVSLVHTGHSSIEFTMGLVETAGLFKGMTCCRDLAS